MTLDLWRAHRDREEISLQDAESAISKAVFENPQSESLEVLLAGSRAQQREPGPCRTAAELPGTSQADRKGFGAEREHLEGRELQSPQGVLAEGRDSPAPQASRPVNTLSKVVWRRCVFTAEGWQPAQHAH